jgi:hypothetical protein
MSPLPGKVLPSATVPPMAKEMRPAPLNPDLGRNPSLANGSNPPRTPPGHAAAGMTAQPGANGPGVPRYPLGSRDR